MSIFKKLIHHIMLFVLNVLNASHHDQFTYSYRYSIIRNVSNKDSHRKILIFLPN
eukprot:UN10943